MGQLSLLSGVSILTWISNHMPSKVWYEMTYPFPNFNGWSVEVWEWVSHFIPRFTMYVIIYPWWDLSWSILEKGPGRSQISFRIILQAPEQYHCCTDACEATVKNVSLLENGKMTHTPQPKVNFREWKYLIWFYDRPTNIVRFNHIGDRSTFWITTYTEYADCTAWITNPEMDMASFWRNFKTGCAGS